MDPSIEKIIYAIESLKQETSYFKDYLFPIVSALFTSILGAAIAYLTIRRQENIQIEKDKITAANKWTLAAEQARTKLISIKHNYNGKLTKDPFQRVLTIPNIIFQANQIEERYEDLSFIVPKSETKQDDKWPKWSQINRISAMIGNYNHILILWDKRNDLFQEFKDETSKKYPDSAFYDIDLEGVIEIMSLPKSAILIDLTERLIKLTDDILIELDDFLSNFPKYVKSKIDVKRLKNFGTILEYSHNGNAKLLSMLERMPEPDYSIVERLFGQPAEDIKKRHETGYE
ncbi:MAG: hypothetical protein WC856_26810 [Methylococcaceae bacterium]